MTDQEYEGIHVECDEDRDITDVEIWESYEDYLSGNFEAVLGVLQRDYKPDGVPYFRTLGGFPLPALRAYLEGVKFSISLDCILVDEHLTEDGLHVSAQEPLFIPMVTEEHLYEFAERCIEFEMLS